MSLRLYGYFSILNGVARKWSHEKFAILSPKPPHDLRIYYNILNVGYIFIEGVEVGGWVILMFFWGGARPWPIVLLKVAYYATSSAQNFTKLCQNSQIMLLISEIMFTK